ncbi:MAG TPA: SMP-30/gluconolactonase/LRE family protein [Polyangiaceae bacterium]|nr:SMP-30/gluconolactonase/LRE family protein [Polyangiaceae bacterium]
MLRSSQLLLSAVVIGLCACSAQSGNDGAAAGGGSTGLTTGNGGSTSGGGNGPNGGTAAGTGTAGQSSGGMTTTSGGNAGSVAMGGTPAGGTGGTSINGGTGGTGGVSAGGMSAGGSSGAAGANTGGAGGVGAGGGGGFWGPNGPQKQWTCPPGPYPDQMLSNQMNVCANFAFAYNDMEGSTWIASQGAFFFSNFNFSTATGGDIIKYTPGGDCEVWLHDVACNGMTVSPSGNLLTACQGPRALMEYDVTTKQGRVVASMVGDKMLDSPNDVIARSDGNVYFSNRLAELGNRPVGLGESLVRMDPMGNTSVIQMGNLNGVGLSPDETQLLVVSMGIWALDADGTPGAKSGPAPGGDGFAVDCAGNVLVNGTNSAFGGADGKTLLIVGGGTSVKVATATVPGLP